MVSGGKFYQLFLTFSLIFTWIKYYEYVYLDFSVGLLTKVCGTGDSWEYYLHSSLEPKGARRYLRCWKCCFLGLLL